MLRDVVAYGDGPFTKRPGQSYRTVRSHTTLSKVERVNWAVASPPDRSQDFSKTRALFERIARFLLGYRLSIRAPVLPHYIWLVPLWKV